MCRQEEAGKSKSQSNDELVSTLNEEQIKASSIEPNRVSQWKNKNDEVSSQFPSWIEALPASQQFVILSGSMFLFFGVHNLLQEAIMKVPGFEGVMLTYMEVLG